MQRADWAAAIRMPIGVIPGGSGNAMARSVKMIDPVAATLAVIKRHTVALDLLSVRQVRRQGGLLHLLVLVMFLMWVFRKGNPPFTAILSFSGDCLPTLTSSPTSEFSELPVCGG
jgi:hypothetical protein